MSPYRVCLTIAGSDSSGGAGIQADLKTFSALGCYSMSVITAVTAQNTQGVQAVYPLPSEIITQQLQSLIADIKIDVIKIGMLANSEIIQAVADNLPADVPVILDPVMVATSGDRLLKADAVTALQTLLFPKTMLLTPNLREAEVLSSITISDDSTLHAAAAAIQAQNATRVLIKGGHWHGDNCDDYLFECDKITAFAGKRLDVRNTHGTGCSLSAAIASYLAQGKDLISAIRYAKEYVFAALQAGDAFELGHGHGPIQHFYQWWK